MTLQPGEESSIRIDDYVMGHEMEEPHIYEITVKSNDPIDSEKKVQFRIDYVIEKPLP